MLVKKIAIVLSLYSNVSQEDVQLYLKAHLDYIGLQEILNDRSPFYVNGEGGMK